MNHISLRPQMLPQHKILKEIYNPKYSIKSDETTTVSQIVKK